MTFKTAEIKAKLSLTKNNQIFSLYIYSPHHRELSLSLAMLLQCNPFTEGCQIPARITVGHNQENLKERKKVIVCSLTLKKQTHTPRTQILLYEVTRLIHNL